MPRFSMEAPIPNNEKKIDTPEQERPVPPGYDDLPLGWWLTDRYLSWMDPESKYFEQYGQKTKAIYQALDDFLKARRINERPWHRIDEILDKSFRAMMVAVSRILLSTEFPHKLEKGDYAIILGEDSSGRIPTLFLKEVAKGLCDAHDIPSPVVQFYAGLRRFEISSELQYQDENEKWKREMGEYVENLKKKYLTGESQGKRILICTEAIAGGGSIRNMMDVLEEHGCDFDILTFATYEASATPEMKYFTDGGKRNFFSGGDRETGGIDVDDFNHNIQGNYWLSGVFKNDGDIHARSMMNSNEENSYSRNVEEGLLKEISNQEAMKLSREMAKYVGANVAQAYLDYKAGKFELPTEPK